MCVSILNTEKIKDKLQKPTSLNFKVLSLTPTVPRSSDMNELSVQKNSQQVLLFCLYESTAESWNSTRIVSKPSVFIYQGCLDMGVLID